MLFHLSNFPPSALVSFGYLLAASSEGFVVAFYYTLYALQSWLTSTLFNQTQGQPDTSRSSKTGNVVTQVVATVNPAHKEQPGRSSRIPHETLDYLVVEKALADLIQEYAKCRVLIAGSQSTSDSKEGVRWLAIIDKRSRWLSEDKKEFQAKWKQCETEHGKYSVIFRDFPCTIECRPLRISSLRS